jgi:thiol:disulfide interchange protein DsbG
MNASKTSNPIRVAVLICCLAVIGLGVLFITLKNTETIEASPVTKDDLKSRVGQFGKILQSKELYEYKLTAWLVQAPNGKKMTFYTTSDGKSIFSGLIWDLKTKQKLNANLTSTESAVLIDHPINEAVHETSLLDPLYKGNLPESIAAVDSLGGIKIGSAPAGGTLYIIIDPRCPYCHQAYDALKPYMDKGFSIKWIPTVALGKSEDALEMANAILHAKNRADLDLIMTNPKAHTKKLTGADRETLQRNLLFMFQAFQHSSNENAGVPVAFFVDKNSGQPRMMMGISETAVIETILGK